MLKHLATDSGSRSSKGSSGHMPAAVTLLEGAMSVAVLFVLNVESCLQAVYSTELLGYFVD